MVDAVAVADLSKRVILINPTGQRLLNMRPVEDAPDQTYFDYLLFQPDGKTLYPDSERPMARALRGEQVNGLIAFVRHDGLPEGTWVSVHARPLLDHNGASIGGVVVFHDITDLCEREQTLMHQARLLQEQASLLNITRDATLARDCNDVITY